MSRETYETYSAEPEKIDLIAFLAEYFQAFRKFFLGVLILVILMGGGSFLTAKLRYQPMYEAYTSFVVGSNRAVGYSYYDNVTAQQLGKTFPYIVTSGVLKDVVARDLQVGAVTSQIEASVMENTNLFTIRQRFFTGYGISRTSVRHYQLSGGSRVHNRCDNADGGRRQRRTGIPDQQPGCGTCRNDRSSGGTCRCTAFGLHLCENKKNNSPGR